jgi:EVE domain
VARYWIGVVSRSHVLRGVEGSFAQLGHGKEAPLRRLSAGDWLVYYSPRTEHPDGKPLQAFTAIGQVTDDEVVRVEATDDFHPWRRRVRYQPAREVPARVLLDDLEIVPEPRRWGMVVRRGLVEIGRGDFELIARAMLGSVPA